MSFLQAQWIHHHFWGMFRLALTWGVQCSKVSCLERSCPWCPAGCSGTDRAHMPWQTVKFHQVPKSPPLWSLSAAVIPQAHVPGHGWLGRTSQRTSVYVVHDFFGPITQNSFSVSWCWRQCTSQSSRFHYKTARTEFPKFFIDFDMLGSKST